MSPLIYPLPINPSGTCELSRTFIPVTTVRLTYRLVVPHSDTTTS